MAKPSYLRQQIQREVEAELSRQRHFTIQFCSDAAILAARKVFQRKGEKLVEFFEAFVKYSYEIAEMTMNDAKDDKEMVYTKDTIDALLKDALGENFTPWDERYGRLK